MSDLLDLITEGAEAWSDRDSADTDKAHEPAKALGAECDRCPLKGLREGPVLGELRPGAPVLIVGEAPGAREVERGRPFVGPSGRELARGLEEAGEAREQTSITNALACRPPGGKPLNVYLTSLRRKDKSISSPVDCCLPRLETEIRKASPRAILTSGKQGLASVAKVFKVHQGKRKVRRPGERSILDMTAQRGHHFVLPRLGEPAIVGGPPGPILVATFHPAHALRSARWELGAIRRDLAKAFRFAREGLEFEPPENVIAWAPKLPFDSPWRVELPAWFKPEHDPSRFLAQAGRALEAFKSLPKPGAILTVDIETAGVEADATIRLINLHWREPMGPEWVVEIPLAWRDSTPVEPSPGFNERCRDLTRLFLRGSRLAFQNGTFDTSHLLRERYLTDRGTVWLDTMPAHRASEWGEARHNLGAIMADQADRVGDLELHKDQFLHGGGDKEG